MNGNGSIETVNADLAFVSWMDEQAMSADHEEYLASLQAERYEAWKADMLENDPSLAPEAVSMEAWGDYLVDAFEPGD